MTEATILFNSQTANGSSDGVSLQQTDRQYIIISGTTDGCSIQMEMRSPNFSSEWVAIDGGLFADTTGAYLLERVNDNSIIRATLSSAGASTSVNVEVTK